MVKLRLAFIIACLGCSHEYRLKDLGEDTAGKNNPAVVIHPEVVVTIPAESAVNQALNSPISVDFSRAMLVASITANTSSNGCTGTFQVSSNNFSTCVQMAGAPVATNGNTRFSVSAVPALAGAKTFKIRIIAGALDSLGTPMNTNYTSVTGFTTTTSADAIAPAVKTISPYDTETGVGTNTKITVNFNDVMSVPTITTNAVDTTCDSFSVQLSSDNFISCVPMTAAPAGASNRNFAFTPLANLNASTTYRLRVTPGALDSSANALTAVFTTPVGFTTGGGPDIVPPTIAISDGSTGVPRNYSLPFTFNKEMNGASITTNTTNTTCSGSLQFSSDNFSTCVQMTGDPITIDNITFTIKPLSILNSSTTYKMRVTTAAIDIAGNALAATYTTPTGFMTGTSTDTTAPTMFSTTPADAQAGVSASTTITVTFNDVLLPETMVTNIYDSTCSGTLQVSSDSFATCVQMQRHPGYGFFQFVLTPRAALAANTTYRIRVNLNAADLGGNLIAAQYTSAVGFTTAP